MTARRMQDLEQDVSALERRVSASVSSLQRVQMRTSRVLAATSAFSALQAKVAWLRHVLHGLSNLPQISEDSVDRDDLERELARLRDDLDQLLARFSGELRSVAASEPPRPSAKGPKPWWRRWWRSSLTRETRR